MYGCIVQYHTYNNMVPITPASGVKCKLVPVAFILNFRVLRIFGRRSLIGFAGHTITPLLVMVFFP